MLQAKTYTLATSRPDLIPEDEIQAYKDWRCTAINLARTTPVEPIEADTFDEGDRKMVLGYLGFLERHVFLGIGAWRPTLRMYCQWEFFLKFVHFLVKRGVGVGWLRAHIRQAIFVLGFLESEVISESDSTRIRNIQDMLRYVQPICMHTHIATNMLHD